METRRVLEAEDKPLAFLSRTDDGRTLATFVNMRTGAWTMYLTLDEKLTCTIAEGEHWTPIPSG